MALVRCEECGNQLTDRALACPTCGKPTGPAHEVMDKDGVVQKSSTDLTSQNFGADHGSKRESRQFSDLEFRQNKPLQSRSESRVPLVILMLVLGAVGYYAYAKSRSETPSPPGGTSMASEGTQGVMRRSSMPPPDFGLGERDKNRCARKFEMFIKIASAEAQTYGEERALDRLDRKLEENLSAECLDYMYLTVLKERR